MFGLINPITYAENFYNVYTLNSRRKSQSDRKFHAKLKNKDKKYAVSGVEGNIDHRIANPLDPPLIKEQLLLCPAFPVAHIVLQPNASQFAIFSVIRSTVLEADTRRLLFYDIRHLPATISCCSQCVETCVIGGQGECSCHAISTHTLSTTTGGGGGSGVRCGVNEKRGGRDSANSDADSETEECSEKDVKSIVVPLIVGAGLRSLFELISEARHIQPMLCSKALKALLDVIQGQEPESFKHEPEDLINALYDLLLDLTTMPSTTAAEGDWSAMACSALVGLCIARGDTGQMLKAIAAMLMAPRQLSSQRMQMPAVLNMLQRTVISAALGKPACPDFYKKGIPQNSLVDQFCIKAPLGSVCTKAALASDGTYLYLLLGGGLYKIGTGYNSSYKGHVYKQNDDFTKEKTGWLGYSGGQLYYRRKSKRNGDHLHLVNTDTLTIKSMNPVNMLPIKDGFNYTLFTDESSLNAICTNRDDILVVRRLNISTQKGESGDLGTANELPLQLSRKRFRTLGYAVFEEEVLNQNQILKIQSSYNNFEPIILNEVQEIGCGKEFGLVCATNGKVYYYGKSAALGLKSIGRTPIMKLTELIISKMSIVLHVCVGHDGIHALLVNDDGSVYFTGTARRGEDGDVSKNRRQPKAMKPKKMTKIENHFIIQAACNNGTSAFVTKSGKLIMFGKDTMHCDGQGLVSDFADQHIQKVALGKAHCVAVNAKGQVFTFGLNNKGQCGHVFGKNKDCGSIITTHATDAKAQALMKKLKFDFSNLCDYDDHNVVQGQCRVCVLCKECTGYNVSCVALNVPLEGRVSGAACACGHGDAGCSKCGLCISCIAVQEADNVSDAKDANKQLNRQRSKTLIVRRKDKKACDDSSIHTEENPPRVAPLPPQLLQIPSSSPVVQVACGLHHTVLLTVSGEVFTFGSNQFGQLGTGDLQPVIAPIRVNVSSHACPVPVRQVAAGSNHTVLLTYKGLVYTFGNYQKGQLGRLPHDGQSKHNSGGGESYNQGGEGLGLSSRATESSSTVAQLLAQRQKILWHCTPGTVFGIGPSFGKKAIWIGASGDQTFIKIDESLITAQMLSKINVIANKKTILMVPTVPLNFQTISINRRDGSCTAHYNNQVDFSKMDQVTDKPKTMPEVNQNIDDNMMSVVAGSSSTINEQMSRSMHEARNQLFDLQDNQRHNNVAPVQRGQRGKERSRDVINAESIISEKSCSKLAFAMDPLYDVLWVYDGNNKKVLCYNILASEINVTSQNSSHYQALLAPELSLPCKLECRVSRLQASLNLLVCLDILTSAQDVIPSCFEDITPKQENQSKDTKDNQYQAINRFDNFGGGWGYSGHSVEAIRFSVDTDVILYGFGMFGGRGEYSCKLKVHDLGVEGGDYEKEGPLISETQEVPFECPARSIYHILLPKPVTIMAGRWYLVSARIAGPSSDCGSCGQASLTTEDQVIFTFKSSKKANNGTDVNSGQIPAILYRLITLESKQPTVTVDIDPVKRVTNEFANNVTKECFESLVLLLNWSWEAFKGHLREQRDMSDQLQVKQSLQYLKHVNKCCLRLLRKYTNEIYPEYGFGGEDMIGEGQRKGKNEKDSVKPPHKAGSSQFYTNAKNHNDMIGVGQQGNVMRKPNMENIQLAECIGNVRAMLIGIFCDDIFQDIWSDEAFAMASDILNECHISFVNCFGVFYPTSTLKWNCLCDSLSEMDKGTLHSRLLSAILAGLCSPTVKLRSTFALLGHNGERQSIISPSDNSGLPMLSSTDSHHYPILVEQMIYRTQQEKSDFLNNTWTFKDILMRLLNIMANPIRDKIESVYSRNTHYNYSMGSYGSKSFNQGLTDNCCNLLARVLAEIVYQMALGDYDKMFIPPRSLHSSGSRFSRCDQRRTWSTGNFGPDAIAFTVDRCGIAIAGAMVYSGSGSYEYQLDLLFDNSGTEQTLQQQQQQQPQHKWETLESITGTYDQSVVHNRMADIKFERSVLIKENTRYALRLCSQGARTCSGDGGMPSVRGPCGTIFHFYACDLSFNGTNAQRGQIPCILYYSTPLNQENNYLPGTTGLTGLTETSGGSGGGVGISTSELTMRDTALQIMTDINKKCSELLILARNTLAASLSPSDNSSNNSPTMDSEHNITPIEEHMDINWANNSRTSALPAESGGGLSSARDLSKRLESFSKGIIETLKFEKRSTNPFEMEIEIGATEIHPKDLIIEENASVQELNQITKFNGNERMAAEAVESYTLSSQYNAMGGRVMRDSNETPAQMTVAQILEIFNLRSSNLFHTLLPLVYAHIANLACSDAKSSVHILGLIKDILPHVVALNQLHITKELDTDNPISSLVPNLRQLQLNEGDDKKLKTPNESCGNGGGNISGNELPTTSNHYCIVECEHPYRSASVHCYRVEFPTCVQWLTIEFDGQCGTAQLEDCLLVSIPLRPLKSSYEPCHTHDDFCDILDNNIKLSKVNGKHVTLLTACYPLPTWGDLQVKTDPDWIVVKKFNTPSNWLQSVMLLPGNCVEFTLETSSHYAQDPHVNSYGFKCLVVGYDNPILLNDGNTSLMRIEQELAYLGGMCSANLMKKNLSLPDDKDVEDLTSISETISSHFALLSKGLALSEPELSIHQALESYLPIGSQSNERQFLKDFISGAPGSSGARLAAWLQPEPRLDPNKCELNTITEPLRCGWPTQMTITIHDQYGDAIVVPELKVEVKATPTGTSCNEAPAKQHRTLQTQNGFGGVVPPPRVNYEATLKENMCFKAITFMKPYHNYSFEELRYNSPVQTRVTETLYAQDMEDGMFSVQWTPTAVGSYCLTVTIDGILLEEVHRVEVKEGNMPPPSHRRLTKNSHTPNKLRKFYTENTAGLRIRSHPTLQSEQVGVIKLNGIITFVDEIENDDGVWLRLSTESIRQHCTIGWYPTEAWCLQYNQHFNKILLHPVVETACTTSSNSENNVGDPDSSVSPSAVTVSALDLKPKHREVVENLEPVTSNLDSPPLGQQPLVKSSSPKKSASDVSFESYTQSIDGQITISTNPFFCNEAVADNKTFPISNPEQFQSSAKNGELSGPEEEIQSLPITGPTNAIGSAIAGVVGGGAIKLQALQKWFKGDTLNDSNYGREHHQSFKCSDVSEIASVSVRELVRVMGNQDNKSNGNSSAHQRRSSSPLPIPFDKSTDSPNNSVKSSETSDTSGIISSTTTQDSNKSERRSAGTQFDVINMRKTNFTPSQTAALLSTPKHSLRKGVGSWKATFNTALSTSLETSAIKGTDLSNLEEEVSLLEITTTTTQDQKVFSELRTTCLTGSTEHSSLPVWPEPIGSAQSNQNDFFKTSLNNKTIPMGPIKRAMPPSFAESIRAVFAAFLWHEGIVHDAMACASFLKFHPNLPKEGATVITRREHGDTKQQLSREEKAQQRHSVEVANAGNYLNIRPSTLETLTKSGNFTVHNRKYRKSQASERDGAEGGDKVKLQALPEIVTVLPPALRSLVFLWEHICTNCVQMVQYNSVSQEKVSSREHSAETRNRPVGKDSKESKKTKKKKDDGSWCEVCQVFLPIPVTYHMRMAHPGCGKPAKGKGYNSVGIYCEGWAGNCGEGGKGAASWFIMCETCRDKYISNNKNINNLNNTNPTRPGNELNMFGLKNTALLANSEIYTTMRENANFLLELSSNIINIRAKPTLDTASGVMNNSKRSPQQMPVVVEHQHFTAIDVNKPSTSRGEASRHSRIGLKINGKYGGSSFRKSSCSQERPWLAPETFACLETFGTTNKEEMPYEIFGLGTNDSCIERPLSDISYELSEPINHETAAGQANCMRNSTTLSKFHRSFSMGQGWGMMQQKSNQSIMRQEDNYYPKAVFRRRNNSSTDAVGSLLICYPSENLRRLVPEHMLIATSVVPQPSESDVKVERSQAMSNLDLESANHVSALVQRPSLTFITQKHDLKKLRSAMKRSLRIATCRNYSLQALNWLLRSVTQNVCLHDLMWWFVSSLSTSTATTSDPFDGKYDDYEAALEHPVSYTQISGCLSYMITDSLHKFLQSVADLTLYLPLGSPLQRIAIQCFGIRFRQTDHQFLHSSHVFGNISKILSKSDEQNENSHLLTLNDNLYAVNNGEQNATVGGLDVGGKVIYYSDLNGHFEITVSSRQRMVEALTDNSTETFWESDEEDRNKSKMIEITMNKLIYCCKMLLVHIDNSRDIHSKVSNVTFYGGQSLGDTTLIKSMDVDAKCSAWVTAKIYDDNFTHFRLEFSGPENTLRIRQIKLLGLPAIMCGIGDYLHNPYELPNNSNSESTQLIKNNLKLMNALHIQQQICESETLRVFRLITSQVFGKLITTEADSEEMDRMGKSGSQNALGCMDSSVNSMLADSLDLREHMVGILFSRSKLSHLQKQVIVHIVHAIKKEARRTREDWDAANLSDNLKGNIPNGQDSKSETSSELNRTVDTYCFEMLSMVLALSGSVVGRSYLSHQHGLIKDLLTLLHAGSDRVQRQVTSLLRRILPEISPATFADILGVHRLPPNDYNIAHQIGVDFDMNHLGLLDIFLAVIAKSLHLQVKVKSVGPKISVEKPVPSLLRLCNVLDLSIHLLKPKKPGIPSEGEDVTITDTFSCNDYAFAEYEHFGGSGKQTRPVSRELKKETQKNLNQRWFLNGVIPRKQAESIIGLIRDLATGKMGEKWSQTTKAAIAEAVLNLTRLDDVFRTPDTCIKTATLWLALASLCVLDAEHVEKLSSGQWAISDTRPLCSNHDDGETPAMIQCESCGSLCSDCDRFLHLNRKTRTHKRTVCKEEEEAIRVELHESCGRTKLFWLLALADSKTLKSIVEFRDGNHTIISNSQESVGRCRFCGITGNSGLLEIGNVCADIQCQEHAANACMKTKSCGHACGGVVSEKKCLPCLHHVCHARENEISEGPKLTQDADDMCMICFVEALACAPSIQLVCGHVFHYHCCKTVLEKRWNGPRITFGFSLCPICKTDIEHPMLADVLEPINVLKHDVKRKALIRIKYEGLVPDKDDRDLTSLAMDRYAYYVCFKCQKAYYGGEARCDAEIGEHFNREELVCGGCSDVARAQMCPKHGTDFLEYKCRYCCSVAVYFCFGTTHFCNACHDGFQNVTNIPKSKLPQCPAGPKGEQLMGDECPLHVMHPSTGEEFALGCGVCRKAQTF